MTTESPPRSEWVVAGVSAIITLGAIAFLIYDAVSSPKTPANVRVAVDSVVAAQANFTAHFTAHNVGGATGANVLVAGELRSPTDSAMIERSTVELKFVPARSQRSGGLFFTHDPRRYRLQVRAEGYDAP